MEHMINEVCRRMADKISYLELRNYSNVIVYGAGDEGASFLRRLLVHGFDMKKIAVWDIRYDYLSRIYGITVSKPDFAHKNSSNSAIVIIALNIYDNERLIGEIWQKFTDSGYEKIIVSSDVSFVTETARVNEFESRAYEDCQYQDDIDFSDIKPQVKPIAYYLPQFHETPENNDWWGDGFTEWTNVRKAQPMFEGHYQPREPHDDLGYYDLCDDSIIRKQAEIAKRHGIYGWCIYYYWFSGRKLLTKPIDLLLENKDIDMNFCLMWCNESWTKSWVGDQRKELVKCEYREDDPEKFIDDLKKYTDDERYIRIDGKPLIVIYHIHRIPDVREYLRRWRERALKIGIGEICLFSASYPYSIDDLSVQDSFNGELVFCPEVYATGAIALKDADGSVVADDVYRYAEIVKNYKHFIETSNHSVYLSCLCGWDNTPRYNKQFRIFDIGFSRRLFYDMVKYITEETVNNNKEFIFVFAWNEWAESSYLEPDKRFGYAMLNTFSRAICGLPFE